MVQTLVKMGYENVGWTEDGNEWIYVLQNSAYRLQGVGIANAIDLIQKNGLPEKKACRIIVLDNNVPQLSVCYQPSEGDSIVKAERKDWDVSYELDGAWKQARKIKKKNRSLFKVDILLYPEVSFKNLIITQIYQVLFNLNPTIEVSLWKGMKLSAQMVVPVYNDGYGTLADKVHPGFITAQQVVRLPYKTWATLTLGMFNAGRFGGDLKLTHVFRDERFRVEGRVGWTKTYYWDGFEMTYGTKERLTWNVGGSFYWPRFNVDTTVKLEQYLYGERAIRVDMIRHFRYASIGFYAMKGKIDGYDIKANGGFRFQIALPPYKYKRKGYVPRVMPSNNMGIAYNAGNEQYYYKTYRAAAYDNIMLNNSFNPYFIKSEILNY